MKLVKKISAKDVLENINDIVKGMDVGTIQMAYSVAGIVSGFARGMSAFGEWTRFEGSIQAVNHITGEVVRGKGVHMPEVLESTLLEGITDTADKVESKSKKTETFFNIGTEIEFAYDVSIERLEDDDKGGISYKWHVSPKTEVATNDNLSHLTALLGSPETEVKAASKKAKA